MNDGKFMPGFNDGLYPLMFWARGIICSDLDMIYTFQNIYTNDNFNENSTHSIGNLTCNYNDFWGSAVYSLPFDIQNQAYKFSKNPFDNPTLTFYV